MEPWRSKEALTWKQHKDIQAESLLTGLNELQPMQQARILLARCSNCYSDMMNYPVMSVQSGLERGNELARHLAYFVLAFDELVPSIRLPPQGPQKQSPLHRIDWPDTGFVKIGNHSATSVEFAVIGILCDCWLAAKKSLADITDDTAFSTSRAASIHKTLCKELTKRQLPTHPAAAAALAQEIGVRLDLCQAAAERVRVRKKELRLKLKESERNFPRVLERIEHWKTENVKVVEVTKAYWESLE